MKFHQKQRKTLDVTLTPYCYPYPLPPSPRHYLSIAKRQNRKNEICHRQAGWLCAKTWQFSSVILLTYPATSVGSDSRQLMERIYIARRLIGIIEDWGTVHAFRNSSYCNFLKKRDSRIKCICFDEWVSCLWIKPTLLNSQSREMGSLSRDRRFASISYRCLPGGI